MGSKPQVILIDLSRILWEYSPNTTPMAWLYNDLPVLRRFVEQFTIHNVIAAEFVNYYDNPSDSLIWEFIENKFPDGTEEFENDPNAVSGFSLIVDMLVEETDLLLRDRFKHYGLEHCYTDYLFDHWIDTRTAAFVHINFDPSKQA